MNKNFKDRIMEMVIMINYDWIVLLVIKKKANLDMDLENIIVTIIKKTKANSKILITWKNLEEVKLINFVCVKIIIMIGMIET